MGNDLRVYVCDLRIWNDLNTNAKGQAKRILEGIWDLPNVLNTHASYII